MKMSRLLTVLALLGLMTAGNATTATAQSHGGEYLDPNLDPVFHPLPDNIEILRLENGLEVILMRNPAQPMVGIYTQVKVGSAREDYRTSGMSHMLEHLLFNGSEKYTQEEQYDLADNAGAYNNANTTDFYTNYMMVIPAAAMETGLDIQSQMLFHSILPEDKFAKEKGIVVGEIVQGRDWPGHYAETALRQALFSGSSLELPTVGTKSTIEHMVRDDVYDFYKHWYMPNNMVLTLAGNFDRDQALVLLETYYGTPSPGTVDLDGFRPAALIDRTSTISRRGGDQRILALSFEAPSYGMSEFFPFLVMTELLGLEGSGILTRALDDLEPAVRPDLGLWWEKAPGFGRLTLEFTLPDEAEPESVYRLVQDAVVGAVEMGITGEDILGIVRMSEVETLLQREQLRMTGIYTAESIVLGGSDFFINYLDGLRNVTAEDVTRVLTNWLVDAPALAVFIEPDPAQAKEEGGMGGMPPGMKMPAGMKMPPAMATAMKKQAATGGDEAGTATAPPAPAAPTPLQVDRSVLANGAVLVSQTNPDSPLTAIHLAVRGRSLIDRDNALAGALDIVHRLLSEGIPGCDKVCLSRRLRDLGAVVKLVDDDRIPMDNYYTNGRFSFIRIETAAEYGPEVLDLLITVLQHATFDDATFDKVRQDRIKEMERQEASARSTAGAMLNAALYGEHPLVLPAEGDPASLAGLDFNQVRTVYRKAFSPENLIFSIVGPATHETLKSTLEDQLSGKGTPTSGLPITPVTTHPETLTANVGGQMAAVRLGSLMAVEKTDAGALKLVTAILSDRMAMDLRETRGLSYSVGASLEVIGERGKFTSWINPPVERQDEGRQALKDFIAGFDAATVTQEEMDKIRAARSGRMMMRRLSSMGQAYYLAMAELEGDIPGYLNGLTAYDDLTLNDLQAAAAKYLKEMVLVEVVVD